MLGMRLARATRRKKGVGLPALVLTATLCAAAVPARAAEPGERTFAFRYRARIGPVEAGRGPVHVFVPLPREDEHQHVVSERVEASIPGRAETEPVQGNRFWHGSVPASDGAPIQFELSAVVGRRRAHAAAPGAARRAVATPEELERFLRPNEREVVGVSVLDPILAEIRKESRGQTPLSRARGIYDWVVSHLEYKKVGTGWGNGDTYWACSARYGNCTDFHALFISLARTEGIPARFEIGFPVPDDEPEGEIAGYHCWVNFYTEETGWFPIDASEAAKHPEKRELFFGTQPADRIHFSTGRALRLGPEHRGRALNYFVYPYVEVAGAAWEGPIEKSFAYRDAGAGPGGVPAAR